MSFHAVVPPGDTIIRGIRRMPPATTMTIEADGSISENCYWTLSFDRTEEDEERSFESWSDGLLEELRQAVHKRQIAAVDVGVLLSGGINSSLLVGLMAEAGTTGLHPLSGKA